MLARIRGIQRALCNPLHSGLIVLEHKLLTEYEDLLDQEELVWFQKSREQWIIEGDHNTVYYHASAVLKVQRSVLTL